ncbi:hypothetical protein ACHAPT_004628 [Fusarium lateritium]
MTRADLPKRKKSSEETRRQIRARDPALFRSTPQLRDLALIAEAKSKRIKRERKNRPKAEPERLGEHLIDYECPRDGLLAKLDEEVTKLVAKDSEDFWELVFKAREDLKGFLNKVEEGRDKFLAKFDELLEESLQTSRPKRDGEAGTSGNNIEDEDQEEVNHVNMGTVLVKMETDHVEMEAED